MAAIESRIKLYSLRIVPPEPIYSDVSTFKRKFEATFGKQKYSGSEPHITLLNFALEYRWQPQLVKTFQQLSASKKFQLNIEGFSTFPSNTLLLKVSKTPPLDNIIDKGEGLYNENFEPTTWPLIVSRNPHITISKTKGKTMLQKSLALFENISYTHRFDINRLTLVARENYSTWDWQHDIELC